MKATASLIINLIYHPSLFTRHLKDNQLFFTFHTLLFLLSSYPLFAYAKVDLALWLNSYHHPWLDVFFCYATQLGSTLAFVLFMLLLVGLQQNVRTLLISAGSFSLMSAIVQSMKRMSFFDQLRPISHVAIGTSLHLVEGIEPHTHLSFPSGHAGTIFTAVCLVHLLAPKKPFWLSLLLVPLAVAVAYSRIYLFHHFYRDIYVGALIGVSATTLVYSALISWRGPAWLDQTPLALVLPRLRRML